MKAAYIERTGPPNVIQVGELPLPQVADTDVLVRVEACAVDPIDVYIRSGKYKIDLPFPFIIGRDMVGTVEKVGGEVKDFRPGDRVWCNNQGYGGRQGTFAEYISVNERLLYHLPNGVDALNAVTSVHSALTAVVGLVGKACVQARETVFINGGSGNVGVAATQLGKAIGARVIVTAGSTQKQERSLRYGAAAVVNYKTEDVVASVLKHAPAGVDVYWDLTQQPEVSTGLKLLKPRGRLLLSSGLTHSCTFNVGEFYTHNISMFGFTITNLNVDELAKYAELINRQLEHGTFQTEISKTYPLSEAQLAHQLVEEGGTEGKVVVTTNSADR